MRICLVSSSFYPAKLYGGPIFSTWNLANKLIEKGVEIYVSTTNANGNSRLNVRTNQFVNEKKNFYIKYYHEELINRLSFTFCFGIWSDIRNADIVYIQYLFHYTVLFSLLFSVIQKKKIIICPRGSFSNFTLSNSLSFIKLLWLKLFITPFNKSIHWHATSYLEKEDIIIKYPDAKVNIVNDSVDFQAFQNCKKYSRKQLFKEYLDIDVKYVSNIFFSLGRLHKIKRFDVLIDAFALYIKKDKYAKLIIAGEDYGVEEELRKQIINLNIEKSIFLIGPVNFDSKKIFLNNCDFFTLASDFESFGIVVIEALACGKPIVLSNKTPWKDLEKKNCGIFINNDKETFYKAFLKVVKNKYNSKEIKDYVRSNYDLSIIATQFLNNFKDKCIF